MRSPIPQARLAVALCEDQRRRWRGGERPRAEDYLARHPELRQDAEGMIDLIFNEFLLREQLGESPAPEEYLRRFPECAETLEAQILLHQAVNANSTLDGQTGETLEQPASWPKVVGYEILAELGRGGMGVVYKARHLALNRVVALKCVLAGPSADAQQLVRFRQEAEFAARLHQPNVVQIYEVGEYAGSPYLALEYIDGPSLAQYLEGRPRPAQEAAWLVEALARAVEAAHDQGIVHRDLKPANVLLAGPPRREGGDQVTHADDRARMGAPKITDFGLARHMADDTRLTQTGAIVGTPAYMAPEQARGGAAVGPAADVYALGAILYEILTGRPPFQAATVLETLHDVLGREPVSPSSVVNGLPRDLVTVCLKCLQKKPEQRYPSAAALAEDLRRFQLGEPIRARPVGPAERAWRWARRNPVLAGTFATVATLLVVIAIGSSVGVVLLQAALKDARDNERKGEERLFESLVAQADANRLSRRAGQRFRSLELLDRAADLAHRLELPEEQIRLMRDAAVTALALPDLTPGPEFDIGNFTVAQISEDGTLVASLDPEGVLTLRRHPDGNVLGSARLGGVPMRVTIHPRGNLVAASVQTSDQRWWASVFRITDGGLTRVLHEPDVLNISFQRHGPLVALTRTDLLVVDLDTRTRVVLKTAATRELGCDLHPSLPLVAVNSYFATRAEVLDIPTRVTRATIRLEENGSEGVRWSPDGRYLVLCEQTNALKYETNTFRLVHKFPVSSGGSVPAFNASGDRLLVLGWDMCWHLFDFHAGRVLVRSEPMTSAASPPTFLSDGQFVGLTKKGARIGLLRLGDSREFRVLTPTSNGSSNYWQPALFEGDRLLALGAVANLYLWDLPTGRELPALSTGTYALADPSNGDLYASLEHGVFRLPLRRDKVGALTLGPPSSVPVPSRPLCNMTVSRDGTVLATANRQLGATIWHARTGRTITPAITDLQHAEVSPDGRWLATAQHHTSRVQLWNATDGKLVKTFPEVGSSVSFSRDGRWLAIWGEAGALYSTSNWEKQLLLSFRNGVFAPDNEWLVGEDANGTFHLRRLSDGAELGRLEAPEPGVHQGMCLTADGATLVAPRMGKKLTVDLWDLRLLGQRLRDRGIALDWPTFPPEKRSEEITEVRWDDPQRMLQGLPRSEPREIAILRYTLRLSAHPFDAEARYRRGLLLSMIDTPRAQAASLVDLSLAIGLGHPRSADAHHQRGHLYEQRRSWQEAAEDFTAAIAGLPEKRGHLFGVRGGCRLRQRRYADAVKDLGEAWPLTRDSNEHATVSRDLCHAYLVGKIEPPKEVNLVELARTAVGLEPDRGMHHVTLGLALHRAGKHREAVAAVDQSQKLPDHPTHGLGLVVRAAALARLGDMTEARASFDQAAAWRKKHPSLAPYLQAELDQFSEEASRASSR